MMKLSLVVATLLVPFASSAGPTEAALAWHHRLQATTGEDCATAIADLITCQVTNCLGVSCADLTPTPDAPETDPNSNEIDCVALEQDFCSAFQTDCCPACADVTTVYVSCMLAASIQIFCPEATCDGVVPVATTNNDGTSGGSDSTGSGSVSESATSTPQDSSTGGDGSADGDAESSSSTPPDSGNTIIPGLPITFPPEVNITGVTNGDDDDICEESLTKLDACTENHCPQCEEELEEESSTVTLSFSCQDQEKNFCSMLDKGKQCCGRCKDEIDEYAKCAVEQIGAFCKDFSCDGIGSSGGNHVTGFAAMTVTLALFVVM